MIVSRWTFFNPPKVQRKRQTIMFFGDSITQHGFQTENGGWLIILNSWWTRRADILNRGFSGYCSRWARYVVDDVVISEHPNLLFVFFGANDAIDQSQPQHVPLEEFQSNLEEIIRKVHSEFGKSFPIALITPPPIWEPVLEERNKSKGKTPSLDRTNVRTRRYVEVVKRLGKSFDIPVLDLWDACDGISEDRALYLIDGLHLNAAGNQKLAEAAKALISKHFPQFTPDLMDMQLPDHTKIPDEWKI